MEKQAPRLTSDSALDPDLALLLLGCAILPVAAAPRETSTIEARSPATVTIADPVLVAQEHARTARDDAHGHEGKVMSLNSRATILMTMDGNHLCLPKAMVFKGVLPNYTRNPMRRLRFTLGIGTGEDLNAVRRLGVETLLSILAIAAEPEPRGTIQAVGDSSVLVDFSPGWTSARSTS